ncbi:MAG: PEP-CTERM sorting domain-containing protein [Planctomycetales bacterium]|nr:PEP-CTERM sorting domain-containing protein [Planctomycetales bacterium]
MNTSGFTNYRWAWSIRQEGNSLFLDAFFITPEPAALALALVGLVGLCLWRPRRRR